MIGKARYLRCVVSTFFVSGLASLVCSFFSPTFVSSSFSFWDFLESSAGDASVSEILIILTYTVHYLFNGLF